LKKLIVIFFYFLAKFFSIFFLPLSLDINRIYTFLFRIVLDNFSRSLLSSSVKQFGCRTRYL